MPDKYRLLRLDASRMTSRLGLAQARGAPMTISIEVPLPDGRNVILDVYDSPIMAPALAKRYPEIRTYSARGRNEPSIQGRLDLTRQGFHGILDTPDGQVFIDPRGSAADPYYVSYYRRDYLPAGKGPGTFNCLVHDDPKVLSRSVGGSYIGSAQRSGDNLRTYRLAVAATGEYTAYQNGLLGGDPVDDAMSAIVTTINRVNQIMMRDLSIELSLVADNDQIIYTDPDTDPYDNNDGVAMLAQNQNNVDNVIGSANYDLGHVFSTGGGGIASLDAVCDGSVKAQGVTGSPAPIGDPFDIDYVAHEMGHQLGANHTFNSTTDSCGGNRNGPTAVEPGSGSTVMAYAGICGSDDLQPNSDAMYSTVSIDEIVAYTVNGDGDACAAKSSVTTPPVVSAPVAYTIPASTPFELSGSATDTDSGDTLTYSWEEIDAGQASNVDIVLSDNAIFRAFEPVSEPTRVFPRLVDLLAGTSTTGEVLPGISRDLNFRLTARDQNGGVDGADTLVQVVDTGQAFAVTSFNSSVNLNKNSPVDVSWEVADTDSSPIDCSSVDITMSDDGGFDFSYDLALGTPNDGLATVITPDVNTVQARFKVECSDSVFFDINDVDLVVGNINTAVAYEDVPGTPLTLSDSLTPCTSPLTRQIEINESKVIADMDFGFNADHAWRGDLRVRVRSPDGTEVDVIEYDTSTLDSDHNYDVHLDDESALPLDDDSDDDTTSPYYDRNAVPDNPLSAFDGENAMGTWTVEVCDNYLQDDGEYRRSSLFILERDNDEDGLPDSADPDDDNDGISDTFEEDHGLDPLDASDAHEDPDMDLVDNFDESVAGSDPQDPDTDGDGIGDAYDDQPGSSSNLCSGTAAVLADKTVGDGDILQCAAEISIDVQNTMDVQSGGRLELISPNISLGNGFSIPVGAELSVKSVDPVPP